MHHDRFFFFRRVHRFFPCQYHSTGASCSSSTCRSYQNDKRLKSGCVPKGSDVSEIWERWIEMYVKYFIVTRLKFNLNAL